MPEAADWTILLSGFSKAFAMTGWRIGYATGPAEIIAAMTKIHQYCMMCAPIMAQRAAETALREGLGDMEEMCEIYRQRRNKIVRGLNDIGLPCHTPGGAFYAFPSIRHTGLDFRHLLPRSAGTGKGRHRPGQRLRRLGRRARSHGLRRQFRHDRPRPRRHQPLPAPPGLLTRIHNGSIWFQKKQVTRPSGWRWPLTVPAESWRRWPKGRGFYWAARPGATRWRCSTSSPAGCAAVAGKRPSHTWITPSAPKAPLKPGLYSIKPPATASPVSWSGSISVTIQRPHSRKTRCARRGIGGSARWRASVGRAPSCWPIRPTIAPKRFSSACSPGSGPTGLAGIRPIEQIGDLTLVRPLLAARRADLRAALAERGLPWHDDPTNADREAKRGWVRNILLPLMGEKLEFDPGATYRPRRAASGKRGSGAHRRHRYDLGANLPD